MTRTSASLWAVINFTSHVLAISLCSLRFIAVSLCYTIKGRAQYGAGEPKS